MFPNKLCMTAVFIYCMSVIFLISSYYANNICKALLAYLFLKQQVSLNFFEILLESKKCPKFTVTSK